MMLSDDGVEKVPTAAGFVRCGDADESNMLAKQTSLQEQFILNSSGDGGSSGLLSNSAPAAPQLIETDPQHLRFTSWVNHPLHEVVLFADQKFPDASFGCLMSVSKKTSSNFSVRHLTGSKGVFGSHPENHTRASHQHLGLAMGLDASCFPAKKVPFCIFTYSSNKANQVYHLSRGLSWPAKNNNHHGASILMVNGGGGTDGISILDSGGAVHASGNISLFTQLGPVPQGTIVYAANGEEMACYGCGSIRIPRLGMELRGVLYLPCMGDKTIVSVAKLNELGYGVILRKACCFIEDERTWTHKLVGEGHLVDGQFVLDYLKISLDRAPVSDGTFTLLWRDVWMRWNRFTEYLFQRDERLPR